jgi:hypothetical protein
LGCDGCDAVIVSDAGGLSAGDGSGLAGFDTTGISAGASGFADAASACCGLLEVCVLVASRLRAASASTIAVLIVPAFSDSEDFGTSGFDSIGLEATGATLTSEFEIVSVPASGVASGI